MGVYRSVNLDLVCQRCGAAHQADVQFKTGRDWCEEYAIGDRVEDLPVGEEWEGIADRFCRPCEHGHRAERERAMAMVLAARVQAGQLGLKLADAQAPLTPEEILVRGEEKAEAARQSPMLYGSTMVLADLWCLGPDGTWTSRLPDSWWLPLYEALQEELRRRGWPLGDDCFREDLAVYLDEEHRIRVRVIET
jgi:hypothetical protein